jgi:hypothetical protein
MRCHSYALYTNLYGALCLMHVVTEGGSKTTHKHKAIERTDYGDDVLQPEVATCVENDRVFPRIAI